jgi:hypothetical protein
MSKYILNTNDKGEMVDTGHPVSRKPYSAPKITFIEDLEVIAGYCTKGDASCSSGPTNS